MNNIPGTRRTTMKTPLAGVFTAITVVSALLFLTCEEEAPRDTSPPTEVTPTVSAAPDGSAEITWTDPTDADFSHVLITWEPAVAGVEQPVRVEKGAQMATITGLNDGIEYTFTVASVDTAGNQATPSAPARVTADATPPDFVTSFTHTLTPNGGVTFTWDDPSDSDFSHVRIKWNTVRSPLRIDKGIETAVVTGLPHGHAHQASIQSVDIAGNGSIFVISPAFFPDAVAPLAVTNINSTVTSASISLTWTDPTANDLSHINVTWSPADGGQQQPLRIDPGVQAAALTGLDSAAQYTVTISSSDAAGNGTAATATPTTAVFNPAAVTAASATTVTADGTTTISWTDPTATSSIAKISITGTPAPTTAVEAALGAGTANITGLTSPGSRHTFTINTLDSSDAVLGTTTVDAAAATVRPIALFRLGGTDTHDGDFGFGACNTELTGDTGTVATALRGAGYTEAVFFGSKTDSEGYIFLNLATDDDALGLAGASETNLEAREVVVYPTGYTSGDPTATFGTPAVTRTIGNIVNVGLSGGWLNSAYDVIDDLVTTGNFWTFSAFRSSSAFNCSNAGTTDNLVTGTVGTSAEVGLGVQRCDTTHAVLCAAH